jgi:hypothetical protein
VSLIDRSAFLIAVTATLLLVGATARADCVPYASSEAHGARWRVSDVTLHADCSLNKLPDGMRALQAAVDTWQTANTQIPRVWLVTAQANDPKTQQHQGDRSTVSYAAAGEPRAQGALAITLASRDSATATIVVADIILNGIYDFGDCSSESDTRKQSGCATVYDLQDVLTHEFGHWLGLPENPDDSSATMYPCISPGETSKRVLGDSDLAALEELYGQDSSTEAPGAAACSAGSRPAGRRGSAVLISMAILFGVARARSHHFLTASRKMSDGR